METDKNRVEWVRLGSGARGNTSEGQAEKGQRNEWGRPGSPVDVEYRVETGGEGGKEISLLQR